MDETTNLIISAIEAKKPIEFEYHQEGKPSGIRIGNPHAIFRGRNRLGIDNTYLHVVQTAGVSETSVIFPSWRMFFADRVANVRILEDDPPFEIHPEYNPYSPMYSEAVCKI